MEVMNHWTKLSIEYANQRNYLDELFRIYPTIPEGIREIDEGKWQLVERAFEAKDNSALINSLLDLDLFPIKDSYVAFLKRDREAIKRNPKTVNRLCGRLYEIELTTIFEKSSIPKETNRQSGPLFKRWINSSILGLTPINIEDFSKTSKDAILSASDAEMMHWAKKTLGYTRNKGLDFIARFNGKYVIGEAKFLTDFGGHQNAQFEDAISTLEVKTSNTIKIAILDGVLYLKTNNKMYKDITTIHKNENILSALLLKDFLYSL